MVLFDCVMVDCIFVALLWNVGFVLVCFVLCVCCFRFG